MFGIIPKTMLKSVCWRWFRWFLPDISGILFFLLMTWGCHNQDIMEMLNNDIMGYWMILLAGFWQKTTQNGLKMGGLNHHLSMRCNEVPCKKTDDLWKLVSLPIPEMIFLKTWGRVSMDLFHLRDYTMRVFIFRSSHRIPTSSFVGLEECSR